MMDFLHIEKGRIVNSAGKGVYLHGVNLGGWLMMEGYILGGRNIAEHAFKKEIAERCGKKAVEDLEKRFRSTFIKEEDFSHIKSIGANCVRVPFHYKIITEHQWKYLDQALEWAEKYKIYVILDLHAVPGAQNADWHSDSTGEALLWKEKAHQEKLCTIWKEIALRYKNNQGIAGYDVLNEAVGKNTTVIKSVYKNITKVIREVGDKHIIFVEGNTWSQEFEFLGKPWDEQLAFSFHFYFPLEFTFNFVKHLTYPGKINGAYWDKKEIQKKLERYRTLQKKWSIPLYCGEFGVHVRNGQAGEFAYVKDVLKVFNEWNIHYTYWTYKAVAGGMFPDGIYQYVENPQWINRSEIISGVETWPTVWKKRKTEMVESWDTKYFVEQKQLSDLLRMNGG